MPNKVGKFKVCINCDGCIPVIPESNFYEIEKSFDKQHKNHMMTILTGEEISKSFSKFSKLTGEEI